VIDRDEGYWEIPDNLDTSEFDFNWRPDPYDPPLIHQFGTQWQRTGGPRYVVPDHEGTKYYDTQRAIKLPDPNNRCWRPLVANATIDYSWHPPETDPPLIYIFVNQWHDDMPTYQYRVKGATEKKFVTEIKATLLPNKDNFEILVDDDIEFDYSWVPSHHEPPMDFVFGNQWHDSKTMPTLKYKGTNGDTKYVDDMFAIIKPNNKKFRVLEATTDFDYSWRPDPNDPPYNYIFGNEYHTPEFMPTVMYRVSGAYETKYVNEPKSKLSIEKVPFEDTIFDAVKEHNFTTKYAHFQNTSHHLDYRMAIPKYDIEREYAHLYEDCAIVPNKIKTHLVHSLLDYPYVVTDKLLGYRKPLDIIFISNGETCAEDNYNHLLNLNLPNRIVRVSNINGRVASQHAAANSAETPWYFLVNAKLKINESFNFNWQPNIMQTRKHYIFRAHNPINGLEYGHMAMVANNKKLTLATVGNGLDFTMESPHEVVDILSGTAVFTSAWDVWRTAFREMIKLCCNTDQDSIDRGSAWINKGNGEFGEYSKLGARDAVDYYTYAGGDMTLLMNSYDWRWLLDFYNDKY